MNIINWILYIPLALCVCYLLVYAVASKFYRAPCFPEARKLRRFVILFPAYKEDRVIISSVRSFLQQDYPQELFDIIVISDQMQDTTNDALRSLPIRLLIADYKESSKAKAMTMAMNAIKEEPYDVVAVMDADNLTSPDFLAEVNRAFDSGLQSIQAHRTGKNLNTDISVLDGISEEINNGIFRSGHNVLGLSAALSGSGMAFDAHWFRQNVAHLQTAGEDKELEALLLQQRIHTTYLAQLPIYDEKTQKQEAISNQRKRWIAAQFGALRSSSLNFMKALRQGNIDYCDKIFQWMLPPRADTPFHGLQHLAEPARRRIRMDVSHKMVGVIHRPNSGNDTSHPRTLIQQTTGKSNHQNPHACADHHRKPVQAQRGKQEIHPYRTWRTPIGRTGRIL